MSTKIVVGCCTLLVLIFQLLRTFATPAGPQRAAEARSARAEAPARNADGSLMAAVEEFAAGGGMSSDRAWRKINSYSRADLVGRLNRISGALPEDDRRRVLIAFLLCNLDQDYPLNKKVVVSSLEPKSGYRQFYGDWAAGLMIRLVQRGDRSLLPHLFAAAEWSDGAMSEELSAFFIDATRTESAAFLSELKDAPPQVRRQVYKVMSAGIFSAEDRKELDEALTSAARDADTAPVAREMLRALSASSPE
jgi:hypothetical protein